MCNDVAYAPVDRRLKSSLAILACLFQRDLFSVHFVRNKIDRRVRGLGECAPRARGRRVGRSSGSERGTKRHSSAGRFPGAFGRTGCNHARSCVRSLLCLPCMGLRLFQRVCSRIFQHPYPQCRKHCCHKQFQLPSFFFSLGLSFLF